MEDPTSEAMETEENLSRVSIPKSSSFSPKVARPKLPPFAGSGGRSISPRSKTDPGRGEIKAIMEDIMTLKKTDWTTFSRSRTMPRSKGKSMSTNTSPSPSPRIGSPVSDDSNPKSVFTRDRSRSLKLLTDKLKKSPSKHLSLSTNSSDDVKEIKVTDEEGASQFLDMASSGNTCEQWNPQHLQSPHTHPGLSGGSPRRSPDRRSMERMYEQIPESPEDVEQEEAEDFKSHNLLSASSEESFRSVPDTVQDIGQMGRERTPDSDTAVGIREKSPESDVGAEMMTRSHEDYSKPLLSDKSVEDEGVIGDMEEQIQPVVSTYIYHPIPRNSKFLQLAATKPPKRFPPERRSGITMVSSRGRVSSFKETKSEDLKSSEGKLMPDDHNPRQRLQRRSDSGKSGKSGAQKSSPRFITHPPHAKSSHSEAGSVDSNGFAALKSSTTDSEDDFKQNSQLSLADSQFASEGSEHLSYHDVMESVVSHSAQVVSSDRKNGKSGKQKSKSDPSGDKTRDVLDFPRTIESPQSHSAPLLSKDKSQVGVTDKSLIISDDDVKQKSRSDNFLSTSITMDEEGVADVHSSDEEESGVNFRLEQHISDQDTLSPPIKSSSKVLTLSAPGSPHGHSPGPSSSPVERPTNLLSVPSTSGGSGRKPNIFRSASSASVLQSRKNSGTPSREKEVVRKYSITTDEAMVNSKSSVSLVPEFLPLGDTSSSASSMPAVWNKDRLSSSDSPEREPGFIKDKRYHIVEELYKNEKEYVEALRTLKDMVCRDFKEKGLSWDEAEDVAMTEECGDMSRPNVSPTQEKYMVPLKTQSSVDDNIVDNIFYMIPEILTHHSIYLDFLDNVWKHWETLRSTVGNIITTIFAKQTVLESYMSFVENYKASGKVIEHALNTKSSVQKFIEQCQKDSGSKLTMKDLIVRPIQRIPRYELLIQRLLDNTPRDHPDSPLLQQACRVMHDLAMKIGTVNDSQQEEDMQETLKKLELLLISDLAVPDRSYIRHDMVQLFNKKDQCCIWLFSDVIIVSSIKRKSGPVTRKVSIILKTPNGPDYVENIKHKVWLRVGLDDLEIVKTQGTLQRKPTIDREQVEEDLNVVNQITDLANRLSCQHQGLDDAMKEMNTSLSRQLIEANARSALSESNKMELLVTTQEGVLHLVTSFASAEKRSSWETAFTDAKQKLSLLSDKRAPEFLQPLPITKTRAGMQFSCAAPIDGVNSSGYRDVWVCNSDGYVGHMCLLSLQPEPIVTLNTPVPGCNARILCICAVTAFSGAFRRRTSQKGSRGQRDSVVAIPERPRINVEQAREELPTLHSTTSSLASPTSEFPEHSDLFNEEGYQSDSESSDDDEPVSFISRPDELYVGELLSDDEASKPVVSELTESSPDPITTSGSWDQDPTKSTMWLGTEDGCIHIFQSCDNIKTTKNKLKIQHGSPVYCIIYLDNKVFVSLVNGDLIVYKRDPDGMWDTEHPYTRTIGSATSPITRMLAVAGKLWCGCQNQIHVINPLALNIETSFQVSSDTSRTVQCLVSSGQGVWVASQQSSKVVLFHAVSYEFLLEVSIAQAVSQKLQSSDDIIRQHKAACLRITSLMVCKDLLWVGTSAGVVLTIPIPRITSTTTRGSLATPTVTGLIYGHTGHVRFLTSVELSFKPDTPSNGVRDSVGEGGSGVVGGLSGERGGGGFSIQDIQRRSSMAATTATMASRMLVISGGDGYEDFRSGTANEGAGRDDSTNHLLLWQV